MTGAVTRDELATDALAPRESLRMIAGLSRRAKSVRAQISEIEGHAAEVDSPDLKNEAVGRVNELRLELYRIVAQATNDQHTPDDIQYWVQSVMARGGQFPTFDTKVIKALRLVSKVPNAALREGVLRFLDDGINSYADIVRTARERLEEIERTSGEDHGSTAWSCDTEESTTNAIHGLRRRLGLESTLVRGLRRCAFLIKYEDAVAVSQAIGMNPLQAGV